MLEKTVKDFEHFVPSRQGCGCLPVAGAEAVALQLCNSSAAATDSEAAQAVRLLPRDPL